MASQRTQKDLAEFTSDAPKWYQTYEWWSSYPLFVLGLMFLAAMAIQALDITDPVDLTFVRIVIPLAWAAFALDYVVGISLSKHKWHFIRSHPFQLAAVIFPPLRILMFAHIVSVLEGDASRAHKARVYLLLVTTLTAFVGAITEVYFELQSPDSNIRSFGNALWWVGETVSTVGYGDFYPVTIGGRLVAGVLFFNGVALMSIVTATLAQHYMSNKPAAATSSTAASSTAPSSGAQPSEASTTTAATTAADSATVTISRTSLTNLQRRVTTLEQELEDLLASAQPVATDQKQS